MTHTERPDDTYGESSVGMVRAAQVVGCQTVPLRTQRAVVATGILQTLQTLF